MNLSEVAGDGNRFEEIRMNCLKRMQGKYVSPCFCQVVKPIYF
jgi:hypothetical protein